MLDIEEGEPFVAEPDTWFAIPPAPTVTVYVRPTEIVTELDTTPPAPAPP
jgi:hypothetical protein